MGKEGRIGCYMLAIPVAPDPLCLLPADAVNKTMRKLRVFSLEDAIHKNP